MTTEPAAWTDDDAPRAPDRFNLALAAVALALLAGAAWLRFGPGLFARPVRVGEPMPPTRLAGLHDDGSRLLLGMEGRILWLVFLPAEPAEAAPVLPELASAWGRLKDDPRFGMAVAAADGLGPELARASLEPYRGKLPLYLAGADAPRSFGVEPSGGPWHFLVDPHGRVAAVARGSGKDTVDRLAKMAAGWLDALAPAADARFRLTLAGP
ncbi:MAG: hypothetical protein BGO49_08010 [Planctomycetales bacterium 71-10]|nr:MAG: hypothetical protein BGO49_08010 [Planctomycetales bacterium 71-10]